VVKVFGYGVYAMFALGVLMSWYFSVSPCSLYVLVLLGFDRSFFA
jgi:F0F1-type ATP synthase assembly protein I